MKKELSEAVESKRVRRKRSLQMLFYEIGRIVTQILFGRLRSKRILKAKTKQTIFIWGMLAIPILNFLVFWVYVNFNSILLAFQNIDYAGGGEVYWTLENFKTVFDMFANPTEGTDFWQYGANTLKFWSLSVFWGIPHSILLTYVFHKKLKGSKVYRIILYLPSIICGVVVAEVFASFISDSGPLGYALINLCNVDRVPGWFTEQEFATNMLLFYAFFFGFAGHYVIFSGAMAKIPREITEAALLDGVGMWKELWYIVIPLMWPTISMQIVVSFAGIFGASGNILLFTPNVKSTWTLGYWIFDQVRQYQSYYIPATLGLVFTVIAFPLGLLVRKLVNSIYQDVY